MAVRPGTGAAFEDAVRRGYPAVAGSPGFRSLTLHRGVENPDRYLLLIGWDRVEDHTVGFRGSDAFTRWRAEIGPFLDGDPEVDHYDPVGPIGGTPVEDAGSNG